MTDALFNSIVQSGYKEMMVNGEYEGYHFFFDAVRHIVNAVLFIDADKYRDKFISAIKLEMKDKLEAQGINVHYMEVILVNSKRASFVEEMFVARQACADNSFTWIFDEAINELIIYENQTEDFYGLKNILENVKPVETGNEETGNPAKISNPIDNIKALPKVTSILVLINVVTFILCTFTGTLLYNKGGVGLSLLTSPYEYYRVITSMFLHANIAHLFGNMVNLFFLGEIIEKKIGPWWFLGLYFVSGIVGTVATFISEVITDTPVIVIGASGAVFGLFGILLTLVLFKEIRMSTMPIARVIVIILFMVLEGFSYTDVAVWAHVGGLFGGILYGMVYYLLSKNKGEESYEN